MQAFYVTQTKIADRHNIDPRPVAVEIRTETSTAHPSKTTKVEIGDYVFDVMEFWELANLAIQHQDAIKKRFPDDVTTKKLDIQN